MELCNVKNQTDQKKLPLFFVLKLKILCSLYDPFFFKNNCLIYVDVILQKLDPIEFSVDLTQSIHT